MQLLLRYESRHLRQAGSVGSLDGRFPARQELRAPQNLEAPVATILSQTQESSVGGRSVSVAFFSSNLRRAEKCEEGERVDLPAWWWIMTKKRGKMLPMEDLT